MVCIYLLDDIYQKLLCSVFHQVAKNDLLYILNYPISVHHVLIAVKKTICINLLAFVF